MLLNREKYAKVFGTEHGREVLTDILRYARFHKDIRTPEEEGARRLALYIYKKATTTQGELDELERTIKGGV